MVSGRTVNWVATVEVLVVLALGRDPGPDHVLPEDITTTDAVTQALTALARGAALTAAACLHAGTPTTALHLRYCHT